jgi:hypothetical protein
MILRVVSTLLGKEPLPYLTELLDLAAEYAELLMRLPVNLGICIGRAPVDVLR